MEIIIMFVLALIVMYVVMYFIILGTTVAHEAMHLVAAWILGFRIEQFRIGSTKGRKLFQIGKFVIATGMGGAVEYHFKTSMEEEKHGRLRLAVCCSVGVIGNILFTVAVLGLTQSAELAAMTFWINLTIVVTNIIPIYKKGNPVNDGSFVLDCILGREIDDSATIEDCKNK